MSLEKIKHTMESFYLSCHLSICATTEEQKLLLAADASHELIAFIKEKEAAYSADLLKELMHFASSQLDAFKATTYLVYTLHENLHFAICPIHPHEPLLGFYMIGPYTSDLSLKHQYLYKPDHCIKPLIGLLYTFYQMSHKQPNDVSADSHCNYHINRALAYIDAHAHESITLSELADYLDINKSYLCTLFKKYTNDCFSTYLNKIRIEKSKTLLASTTYSILDIALQVGFSNVSYYHTLFKKLTGMTPLAYRQQHHP